jgi:hypothetical protein
VVEQLIRNQQVVGSIPTAGSNCINDPSRTGRELAPSGRPAALIDNGWPKIYKQANDTVILGRRKQGISQLKKEAPCGSYGRFH